MEEQLAVDLLSLYIGVEHYNECDEYGNIIESKEICIYAKTRELKCGDSSRIFLVNLETCDEIKVDQNGEVLSYESEDIEIMDIEHVHSLHEAIDELIKSTENVVIDMENGKESLDYFKVLKNHMDKMEKEGNPAYLDLYSLPDLIHMVGNIYTLSFGNPLTQESKTRCLYKFTRGGNVNGV